MDPQITHDKTMHSTRLASTQMKQECMEQIVREVVP